MDVTLALIVIFTAAFVGAAVGAALGVWLAWHRIRNEVMRQLGNRAAGISGL